MQLRNIKRQQIKSVGFARGQICQDNQLKNMYFVLVTQLLIPGI